MDNLVLMDEEILRARNLVVSGLAAATGVRISLSDEQDPAADPPYGYYSVITPYASTGELGSHTQIPGMDPETGRKYLTDVRAEYPEMVLSFSFCSANRQLPDGTQVNGEAEAMALALKGAAWLLHEGREKLSFANLVILRVGNSASRSGTVGDVYVRRWGFDAAIRYKALTARKLDVIGQVITYQSKEE